IPQPARTTTLLLNILGLHATPMRGANPHCRPVRVELLTPEVPCGLFPATIKPVELNGFDVGFADVGSFVGSYEYFDGSKLRRFPFFSVNAPSQSKRIPAVIAMLLRNWNLS